MRNTMKQVSVMVLFAAVLGAVLAYPAFSQIGVMPTVRFSGSILAPDAKDAGGLATLKVMIDNTALHYNVTKAENLNDPDMTGLDIVENLDNRLVLKEGSKGVLDPLRKADIAGKAVTLEGLLDGSSGFMEVTKLSVGQ